MVTCFILLMIPVSLPATFQTALLFSVPTIRASRLSSASWKSYLAAEAGYRAVHVGCFTSASDRCVICRNFLFRKSRLKVYPARSPHAPIFCLHSRPPSPHRSTSTDTFSDNAKIELAPSPRVLAWLLKHGRIPPSRMALTVVQPAPEQPEVLEAPPDTAITPCDPWPRPYYLEDGLRRVR